MFIYFYNFLYYVFFVEVLRAGFRSRRKMQFENLLSDFSKTSEKICGFVDSLEKAKQVIKVFEDETKSRFVCSQLPGTFGKKGVYNTCDNVIKSVAITFKFSRIGMFNVSVKLFSNLLDTVSSFLLNPF